MKKLLYLLPLCVAIHAHAQNIDSAMSAYYPFNGDYLDHSGNNNHATPLHGVMLVQDQWGNPFSAVRFDGIDDIIEIQPSATLTPSDTLSIAFKFRTFSTGEQYLMSKHSYYNTVANYQFNLGFNLDAHPNTGLFFDSDHNGDCTHGIQPSATVSDDPIQTGIWYCVVMKFVHGVKSIYVNGVLQKQETITATGDPNYLDSCSTGLLIFGSHWSQDPEFFSGVLDEVRLYKRALSEDEITSYCSAPITAVNEMISVPTDIAISPNPASTSITINSNEKEGTISIVDAMGKVVRMLNHSNGQTSIDLNQLTSGIYGVRLTTPYGSATKLFIKQ